MLNVLIIHLDSSWRYKQTFNLTQVPEYRLKIT